MIGRLLLIAAAALALAGCGEERGEAPAALPAPVLWELASAGGEVEGWLFGTIHSLPDDTVWRTDRLDAVIEQADLLVVEVAALDNGAALSQLFAAMATTPGQPDLLARVPERARPSLLAVLGSADLDPGRFSDVETWAAALTLAQASSRGDSANGADRALIEAFEGRPVHELEGGARQLGIFDTLPDAEQSDLLVAVVDEAIRRDADPDALQRAWLAGDIATIEAEAETGILADPELREALLVRRNTFWMSQLARLLPERPRPMIAVGTAHLVGPDGLVALLQQRGYTLTRLQ